MKQNNKNLFKSITNNTAPFVSITWHQKQPLGCALYTHIPKLMTHTANVYMAAACLAIMSLSLLPYCRG